jgi:hypothetical protein
MLRLRVKIHPNILYKGAEANLCLLLNFLHARAARAARAAFSIHIENLL